MIFDQSGADYSNSGTIADGVTIAATNVRVTNTDSGRIYGGVIFTTGGSTLVNQLGGVIRYSQFDQSFDRILVTGSDGADTVSNAGLIAGKIMLGGGDDAFVDQDGSTYGVDLGAGDDSYRLEGSQPRWLGQIAGGGGYDTFTVANTSNQVDGAGLTDFERLVLVTGGNISAFSGYQSVTLAPGSIYPTTFFNLLDCLNPLADLALNGHAVTIQRSSFLSITGGEAADYLTIGLGSSIANGVSLGGGNDGLSLETFSADAAPLTFAVDAGTGIDTLTLAWFSASGDRSYDLSSVQGFEKLNVNAWYIGEPSTARVSNISGLTDIDVGQRTTLVLSNSVSPDARVGGAFGGQITLESGTVIGRYGFPEDGSWDSSIDKAQGDPSLSTIIVNRGTIGGDVRFYTGDDLYDGTSGTVGGTVYGNAGNDTLLGGNAGETLVGGYGSDVLAGNGGIDKLTGGAGNDTFSGTKAGLAGDIIADFSAGDRIVITDASIAGFTYTLTGNTLSYTGGSLTLTAPVNGVLVASAAAGGGVQLTLQTLRDVANDFNGDGRSDIMFRHDNGAIFNVLGTPSGGVLNNGDNIYTVVDNAWSLAGTGDFNGDGRDDVLWQHDNGAIFNFLGKSNGGVENNGSNSYTAMSPIWSVVGVGDFNGDGRDDVLFRQPDGLITNWLGTASGGFTDNGSNLFTLVDKSWHVAGIGDFNGDGRDDILFRDGTGAIFNFLGKTNGGVLNNGDNIYTVVGNSWHIAGVGDFNGDGRDDILWRNDNGAVFTVLSTANGGIVNNGDNSYAAMSNVWHVEAIGDYNGDGRDDILWRHDNGTIIDWLGTASGGFADNSGDLFTSIATQWHIQDPGTLWV